jgi:hypothetical protein
MLFPNRYAASGSKILYRVIDGLQWFATVETAQSLERASRAKAKPSRDVRDGMIEREFIARRIAVARRTVERDLYEQRPCGYRLVKR